MGTIASVYNFFNTPKPQNVLRKAIVEVLPASGSQKLVQVCATRWVDRHESVSVFSSLQDAVVVALAEISSWPEKETSPRAVQLLSALRQSEFCIARLVLEKVPKKQGDPKRCVPIFCSIKTHFLTNVFSVAGRDR